MRRLALLFTALILALMPVSTASANHETLNVDFNDPYGGTLTVAEGEIVFVFHVPTGAQVGDLIQWLAAGCQPGSTVNVTFTFTPARGGTSMRAFTSEAAAVAFVGAQSGGIVVNSSAVANANGVARGTVAIPEGADPTAPITASASGTAANGAAASDSAAVDLGAPGSDITTEPETTPATGAESGVLALISLGLVGAGAGAVVLARRRKPETVA